MSASEADSETERDGNQNVGGGEAEERVDEAVQRDRERRGGDRSNRWLQ